MDVQFPSLPYRRTDNGTNTASSTSGQTTAMSTGCVLTQESPAPPGLPNNTRAAVTVEDNGFHSATVPSHAGIVEVATNAPESAATGTGR